MTPSVTQAAMDGCQEVILETIVTTNKADGIAHIAPFGIRERDGKILISPYRPSSTLDHLLRDRCCVLNVTDDVRIFAGALTGHRDWPVHPAKKIQGHVLQAALSHRELVLVDMVDDPLRPQLLLEVIHEEQHASFRGFNRAQAAIVELAVLVSRLDRLPREKIEQELRYLQIAIDKTAGAREWQAWQWLNQKIDAYFSLHANT